MPSKLPWLAFMVLVTSLFVFPRGASAAAGDDQVAEDTDPVGCANTPQPGEEAPEEWPPRNVSEEERGGEEDSTSWDDVDASTMAGLGGVVGLRLRGPPEHQDGQGEDHRWRRPKPPR